MYLLVLVCISTLPQKYWAKNTVGFCICKVWSKRASRGYYTWYLDNRTVFESVLIMDLLVKNVTGFERVRERFGAAALLWDYLRGDKQFYFPFWFTISCCLCGLLLSASWVSARTLDLLVAPDHSLSFKYIVCI